MLNPTDRTVAMLGLESRLINVLRASGGLGMFEMFPHRTLLWSRSTPIKSKKIDYGAEPVPSWSWMAYEGSVSLLDTKFGQLQVTYDISLGYPGIIVPIFEFADRDIVVENHERKRSSLRDSKGVEIGWVNLDEQEKKPDGVGSIAILAKDDRRGSDETSSPSRSQGQTTEPYYHVLFLRRRESRNAYERIGMGSFTANCGVVAKGRGRLL